LKYFQIVQSIGLFVIPPFIFGKFFSGNSAHYLRLDVSPNSFRLLWLLVIMITAIPVINLLASLNSMIRFPEFMSGVQNYIDEASKSYQTTTEAFMKVSTFWGLGMNLLIVAVIPAIGEELFFRGILQRIFVNWTRNIHWGILIPAFIFSAFHLEFYGFFPRWLLGIMFGYFLVWSGSIWVPIFAHFVNNSLAVIAYYLVNKGILNDKTIDIGSNSDILPYTIICGIVSGFGIYWLYRKRFERQD
jgi:membrane protease YdiL (CAAX protease family)